MHRLLSSIVAGRDAPIVKFTKRVRVTFKRLLNAHNSVPSHNMTADIDRCINGGDDSNIKFTEMDYYTMPSL